MRFGKLFFVITLVCAASVAVMLGCSSDSTTTNSPVVEDNGFSAVQAEFNGYTDSLISQFSANLKAYQGLQGTDTAIAFSPVNPDSTIVSDGWHIVYATDLLAGYTRFLVDSIQFLSGGHVQANAIGADQMEFVRHFSIENPDTTAAYHNDNVISALLFSGLNSQTTTVTGGRTSVINTKSIAGGSTVKRTFTIQMNVASVVIPRAALGWSNGCPQSGGITGTVVQTVDRGSVPVTTSWQYELTAEDGSLSGTVTAGSWQKTITSNVCQM
jgi:hypothetical protein